MSIGVSVFHRVDDFALDVEFETDAALVGLFGPSGAGKSTILNVIAGLVRPQRGRVVVDGRVLMDVDRHLFISPHKRRIGYVFQEGRLFPHLTVRQNLTYGRWFSPPSARHGSLDEIVALLGLDHLLHRRPRNLSGGEKQRVAIGRALLASPRLLLMDEPLASLDEDRKNETLPYIELLRDELSIPIVYVSHSLMEIERLAREIIRIEGGRVVPPVPPALRVAAVPAT